MKTNAVRPLDSLGVRYELREYEVDPEICPPSGGREGRNASLAGLQDTGRPRRSHGRVRRDSRITSSTSRSWPSSAGTARWNVSLKEVQPLTDRFAAASRRSPARKTIRCSSTRRWSCGTWCRFQQAYVGRRCCWHREIICGSRNRPLGGLHGRRHRACRNTDPTLSQVR